MNDELLSGLPLEIWRDLQNPDVIWQIGAILVCLALAWLGRRAILARLATTQDPAPAPAERGRGRGLREGGIRRLLFPLLALLLILAVRGVLARYHHVNLLNLAVPLLLSMAAIRMVAYALREAFGPSSWLAGFEKAFATMAWIAVALHIVGWLPWVIGALESVGFNMGATPVNLWLLIQGAVSVLATMLVALWIAGLLERRLMRAGGLDASVQLVLARVTKALLLFIAVLIALPLVGLDLTTLSVFGGALGVGLGFGLQKIAANYVSGFIILLDRSIRIGNLISVGTDRGVVSQITTRYTVLRGLSGVEVIVPNETLVGSVVQNETFTDTRMVLPLNFQVAYSTDLDLAMGILEEEGKAHRRTLDDPAPKALLVNFGESGVDLRLNVWISDPQEGTLGVVSDINLAVWRRFRAVGIEIPFPQREVRVLGGTPAGAPGLAALAAAD